MTQNPMIGIEPEQADVNINIELTSKGEPGYTPQRGVDYWTEEDKQEIVDDVKQEIGELPGGTVKSVNGWKPDENGNVRIEPELPNPKDIPIIEASGSEGKYGKFLTVTSRDARLEWGLDGDVVRFSSNIYSAERPDVLKMGYTRNNDALAYTTRNKKILALPRTIRIDGKVYEPTDDGEIVLPSAYTFPTASKTTKGGVVIGDGIEVEDGGRISVPLANNDGTAGLVYPGKGLEANDGNLSVRYNDFVATHEEQSLTEQEQSQARSNIGAADAAEVMRLTEEKVNKNGVNEVTKENADFIAKLPSTNLFNEETMTTVKSWFYWENNDVGGKKVVLTNSEYTGPYSAIEIPITKTGSITMQMSGWAKIYAYFFTDENNIAITYGAGINAELQNGYTATAPDGAKKMLLSILQYKASYDHNESNRLMVNYGATAAPWEAYGERYVFEGVEYEDPRLAAAVSIVGDKNNAVGIKLPEQYALVVGDTFELFYKGIVNAVNPDLFDVRITCAKGNAYTKRYVWTPTAADVGNHALTVELYGINHNLLATKTIQLVVKNKATSPAAPVNVLCVGDSLTTGGSWVAEFQRRLIATGGTPAGDELANINFIGTRDNGTVHYEGYGGWKFESYVTENVSFNARIITCAHDKDEAVDQHSVYRDSAGVQWKIETVYDDSIFIIAVTGEGREFPESGTLTWVSGGTNHADIVYTASEKAPGNPFWDASTGKVDIAAYAERLGVSSIDYVYVLLGWNDASKSEEDYKRYAESFIRHFRNYKSDIKVVYMGLQIPARDGLGANYGANGTYADYHGLMQYVFNVDKWYSDLKSQHPNNLTTINIAGQFDTEHNSITATRTVNARNSKTETYQSNGVHPAHSGYMQIADAAYRDLTHKLQS